MAYPPDPTPAREDHHDHTPPNLPRIYVAPDESENPSDQPSTKQSRKPQYTRSAVFTGILTLVFGIVFITDFFDGYELHLVGVDAFLLLMGILDIFTDDYHDSPAYKKAIREAKPRRVLISTTSSPSFPSPNPSTAAYQTTTSYAHLAEVVRRLATQPDLRTRCAE